MLACWQVSQQLSRSVLLVLILFGLSLVGQRRQQKHLEQVASSENSLHQKSRWHCRPNVALTYTFCSGAFPVKMA
jgi:hypothetical protein